MNILLWTAQALVSLSLLWGAYAKLSQPIEALSAMMPWAKQNPDLARMTGFVDLAGGLGLLLPGLLRIAPRLTVFAGYGTILLMLAASGFHGMRGEFSAIGMNIFILLLAGFIVWGRTSKVPFHPKAKTLTGNAL